MQRAMLILLLWTAAQTAMAYEEPKYKLLDETADYEIREYDEHIVAEVDVPGDMKESGNKAFRLLAAYIFGDNAGDKEMNMTAPVEAREGDEGSHTYTFMMERKYTLDALPEPDNSQIRLMKRPTRIMAVRPYSGSWRETNYRNNLDTLLAALAADGLRYQGKPVLARYNSPMTPWFLRRNEVMVELVQLDSLD